MREYYTEAVVLDKEDLGDQDARVFLFTKNLGRIAAKVKSAKKITSKLNGHLEPLSIVSARLIENGDGKGFQVVDALKESSVPVAFRDSLRLIKDLSADGDPDLWLWGLVKGGKLEEKSVLAALGFDSEFARCANCERTSNLVFSVKDLDYFCGKC